MKMQNYRNVVDRIHHDPHCKEEVLAMATRQNIQKKHGSFGLRAGTSVAAALLLINGGIAYKVFSGSSKPETIPAASTEEPVDAPLYVQRMQESIEYMSGQPCDCDFTGMGKDLDLTLESDAWKIEIKAMTGCDSLLYYFYDVTPKQGQTAEFRPLLKLSFDDAIDGAMRTVKVAETQLPTDESASVYRYYGIAIPADGIDFVGQKINFELYGDTEDPSVYQDVVDKKTLTLDFIEETPVTHLNEPFTYSLSTYSENNTDSEVDTRTVDSVKITPFGLFFSDRLLEDNIDRANVFESPDGKYEKNVEVMAIVADDSENYIPLEMVVYKPYVQPDGIHLAKSFKTFFIVFRTPVALENVKCFVVSCDGVEGNCTIPVNPEMQTAEAETDVKPEAQEPVQVSSRNLLRMDMSDEAYAALSEDEKTVYDTVRDIWMAKNTFQYFSGYDIVPVHQNVIENGGTIACGDVLSTEYWVDVSEFRDLQRPCDARIRLMYNGNAVPIMRSTTKREYEQTGKFEISVTGYPMIFDLSEVPDGAALTLEVYYTPQIEFESGMNDITVLNTIAFTYDKWDENEAACADCDNLFDAVNCVVTDMDTENLDLSLLEGDLYISADDRIGAADIPNPKPKTSDEMRKSLAYRLTDCYHWDMLGAYQHIGIHIKDGVCDNVILETRSGNVYTHAASSETYFGDFSEQDQGTE